MSIILKSKPPKWEYHSLATYKHHTFLKLDITLRILWKLGKIWICNTYVFICNSNFEYAADKNIQVTQCLLLHHVYRFTHENYYTAPISEHSLDQPISITENFMLTSRPIRITGNFTITNQPTNQSWYYLVNSNYTTLLGSYLQKKKNRIATPYTSVVVDWTSPMLWHFKNLCKSCQSSWSSVITGTVGGGRVGDIWTPSYNWKYLTHPITTGSTWHPLSPHPEVTVILNQNP